MKIILFHLLLLCSLSLQAQKGYNQLFAIAEAGFPGSAYHPGAGAFAKGLFGVGHSAQLSLMAGFSKFRSGSKADDAETTTRLIPFLAGYRQNIRKFYAELQVGYGEMGGRISMNGDYARPSVGAFFSALAGGYNTGRFDLGMRYLLVQGAESKSGGTWHNRRFHYIGIYAGIQLLSIKAARH